MNEYIQIQQGPKCWKAEDTEKVHSLKTTFFQLECFGGWYVVKWNVSGYSAKWPVQSKIVDNQKWIVSTAFGGGSPNLVGVT